MMTAMLAKKVRHSCTVTICMAHLLLSLPYATLCINDELNLAPARVKSLENAWRFPGEFLKILRAGRGTLDILTENPIR
jgi:hypothetical protein